MIYFLHGPDAYRSKEKLNEIINRYKESNKSGLNLIYVDAQKDDFKDLYNQFKVSSMFAEKKLVIVKNTFSDKKFQEDFLEELEALESLKDVMIVYEAEEVDQRLKLFKTLVKKYKAQEFALLDGKNVKIWVGKELAKYNQKTNIDALALLLSYVGNNLQQLSSEIKKLVDYKAGAVIRKEDVELLIKPNIEREIFKTMDALADKNRKQAYALLQKHLDAGDKALYLFSMIQYQFRNLLIVKELAEKGLMYDSIVKKSGLHPFVVKKNYFASQKFSLEELKKIYRRTFQIDVDIKGGAIEPEAALALLVSKI